MVEAVIRCALLFNPGMIVGCLAPGNGSSVNHRNYRVYGAVLFYLWPVESLDQWFGERQSGSLDEDMVDLVPPCYQLFHHRQELFFDSAADATVGEFVYAVADNGFRLCVSRFAVVAIQWTTAQQVGVDVEFAEFVDDYGNSLSFCLADYIG